MYLNAEKTEVREAGWVEKVIFASLTLLIGYQSVYNLEGALELGGKYKSTGYLVYAVGSLMPAIALGVHSMRVLCAHD